MWIAKCTDGAAHTVQIFRYREDLLEQGVSKDEGAIDIRKNFSAAEWTAIIALDDTTTGATVQVNETLPSPAGEK